MEEKFSRILSKTPICGIYQVKNKINGKIYIGQSIDIERRWSQHKYGKGSLILRNAIKKYGLENFDFSILEKIEFINKKETSLILTTLEEKYLKEYEPFIRENGYNINKTSKPNISEKRGGNFGELISKIKIENNHCGKSVIQYSLSGEFIKKWKSAAEIERETGYKAENISASCLKKNYTYKSYIWHFENDSITNEFIEKIKKIHNHPNVQQYSLKGELLNEFNSLKEASEKTLINFKLIYDVCCGRRKTTNGFIWKFNNELLILNNHINDKDKSIKQYDINNNLIHIWDNVKQAINVLSLSKYAAKPIYKCCNKEISQYLGYNWEWG